MTAVLLKTGQPTAASGPGNSRDFSSSIAAPPNSGTVTSRHDRKVVLVSTDEYGKGLRRGEQILFMRAYYGQQRRRLYELGVANIKRLNIMFHAHSEEYWRGYADGLLAESVSTPATPPTL